MRFASVFNLPKVASATTPPSGYQSLYFKTNGGLYTKDSAGVETALNLASTRSLLSRSRTTAFSVANSTFTLLPFDVADQDVNGGSTAWSYSGGTFTCNEAGVYTVSTNVMWAGHATGERRVLLRHNGGTTVAQARQRPVDAADSVSQQLTMSRYFAATDTVGVVVLHTAGVALNVTPPSDGGSPFISIARTG